MGASAPLQSVPTLRSCEDVSMGATPPALAGDTPPAESARETARALAATLILIPQDVTIDDIAVRNAARAPGISDRLGWHVRQRVKDCPGLPVIPHGQPTPKLTHLAMACVRPSVEPTNSDASSPVTSANNGQSLRRLRQY
jgi:hypothetical protein